MTALCSIAVQLLGEALQNLWGIYYVQDVSKTISQYFLQSPDFVRAPGTCLLCSTEV